MQENEWGRLNYELYVFYEKNNRFVLDDVERFEILKMLIG